MVLGLKPVTEEFLDKSLRSVFAFRGISRFELTFDFGFSEYRPGRKTIVPEEISSFDCKFPGISPQKIIRPTERFFHPEIEQPSLSWSSADFCGGLFLRQCVCGSLPSVFHLPSNLSLCFFPPNMRGLNSARIR